MIGLKVAFRLKEQQSPEEQKKLMAQLVDIYKNVPGLKQKYFLADPKTGEAGGYYAFESQEALDGYLKSDIYKQVVLNNAQTEPKIETFIILASLDAGVLI
ncbi:MAG: YdhR family protein [Dehalococcoidia bacterium]